jgi:hypothetical protein
LYRGDFVVLRQLAFVSRARAGLRPSDTSDIIGASRANNAREGVTGVLLYSGESFLQFIEGPDRALSALWRRLLVDDRHRHLSSLHAASVDARWFDDWRAGYFPEASLAPQLERWRAFAPALPPQELFGLRALLRDAQTF